MKDRVLMVLFVLILGSLLSSALIVVNHLTAPVIEHNEEIKLKRSVLQALDIPFGADQVGRIFSEQIQVSRREEREFYRSPEGLTAFRFQGAGVWGPIRGIIAMKEDLKTIQGITILHQEETPGLGGRIAEAGYLAGFQNKVAAPELVLASPGAGDAGDSSAANRVDAITGATMTSSAFLEILNNSLEEYLPLMQGAGP